MQERQGRRASGVDLETATAYVEAMPGSGPGTLRRRATPTGAGQQQPSTPMQRGIARVGTMMAQAHAQDFERKRRPVGEEGEGENGNGGVGMGMGMGGGDAGSSDEEDEFEVGGVGEDGGGEADGEVHVARDVLDAEAMVRRRREEDGEEEV